MQDKNFLICPSCSGEPTHIGCLDQYTSFAGNQFNAPMTASSLYKCNACHLYFRWPRRSDVETEHLYTNANSEIWQYSAVRRRDWQIASVWLKAGRTEGTILDIGCFDGAFLEILGNNWKKFGVEINIKASKSAEKKGVTILGQNLDNLLTISKKFDAVVAFDVIEHVKDPLEFVSQMTTLCRQDGVIIISSGNSDALSWKFMGSKYWYCTHNEHISFINRKWSLQTAKKLNLNIVNSTCFSHSDRKNLLIAFGDLIKNILFKISPSLFGIIRQIKFREKDGNGGEMLKQSPPYWISAKDHLIICFGKKQISGLEIASPD